MQHEQLAQTKETAQMSQKRSLKSWISGFVELYSDRSTAEIFLRWAAVSAIAGALERRVWVRTNAGDLYPNLFVLLVAPPGVGKDQALIPMRDIWAATCRLNISPISMTGKGLLEELAAPGAQRQYIHGGDWVNYHTLLVAVPELGVLLPSHDLGFLSILNELYGCNTVFEERLRKQEEKFRIERPHLHLVAGTQPNYLSALLPEAAFGMGFTSRMIMVYHGTPTKNSLFSAGAFNKSLFDRLKHDLLQVCDLRGQFTIAPEAMEIIEHWHQHESSEDKPRHSKLMHYNARRILHILKLCQAFSVSRSNDMVILPQDFQSAKELLLETEALMPEIFKEMTSGSNLGDMEEAYNFVLSVASASQPMPEQRLLQWLSARVPVYQVKPMLETMVDSGMLEVVPQALNIPGPRLFKPGAFNKPEEGR